MNVAHHAPMSLDEFLEWEDRQNVRHEFDGLQPTAMTGGTAAHAAIQGNIAVAVKTRLRGEPCQFYGNDLKIEVAGSVRYPDGFVVCSPVLPRQKVVRDSVVIFEVLSDGTARNDAVTKNREYAATPSVVRYLMLAQDEIGGTVFERVREEWIGRLLTPNTILRMPEIGIEVPLAEFYEGIELSPEPL